MRTHRRLLLALIAAATLLATGTNAYDVTPMPLAENVCQLGTNWDNNLPGCR